MAIWNWGRKSGSDKPAPERRVVDPTQQAIDRVWDEASRAMGFYLEFREKYNVPFTPERWRDDFALGFRDGICHIHFFLLNDVPKDSDAPFIWKMKVIGDDEALENAWMKAVVENGGYTERAEAGTQAAMILETWRLKRECIRGGFEYVEQHEREYLERHPDATQFNMDHWLLTSHFIIPLIDADKIVHPFLQDL